LPVKIYLADDHAIVAQGIAQLIASIDGIESVIIFENGKLLYDAIEHDRPSLIILDIEMPVWNGIETLKYIIAKYNIPCIMLSMNDEKYIIQECLKLGASGFLHKDCSLDSVTEAIEVVMDGGTYISPKIKEILAARKTETNDVFELVAPITKRELEVLENICEGLTCKEIAEKIYLSTRTVETHKKSIMYKFDVHTTGKLVAMAIKHKFVK
jgi:DNA-binding NarL/FixJ family response regulator